jgi:hypothetical protein
VFVIIFAVFFFAVVAAASAAVVVVLVVVVVDDAALVIKFLPSCQYLLNYNGLPSKVCLCMSAIVCLFYFIFCLFCTAFAHF